MSEPITSVRLAGVSKVFGAVRALSPTTLTLGAGEVVAVLGPNGAGKSTLLSVLSLLTRPTSGQVLINERHAVAQDTCRIGLLAHAPLVYPELTARENLRFFGKLHGIDALETVVREAESAMEISEFAADRPARVLSRGQLQRLALARALLHRPNLLLLDEPASGLDASSVTLVGRAVQAVREQGGMAVLVTHEPLIAAQLATRAVILVKGRARVDAASPGDVEAWRKLYFETVGGAS
ncbi:MAG: heme ABC exporter ATP-binding protein CcmA [Myxococcota bacterium]|jgi:heme exporter protein A|nr:heme ABC exporter ATP-binding protein CcmA [Myxococcota bacterium]